ncbi:hypothetical protein [Nannocystis pusilla]|uniref:hypothetical protein n=1 Tax=Nannocystis pusilla TaxID=889268 RepID=UPI003B7F973C
MKVQEQGVEPLAALLRSLFNYDSLEHFVWELDSEGSLTLQLPSGGSFGEFVYNVIDVITRNGLLDLFISTLMAEFRSATRTSCVSGPP